MLWSAMAAISASSVMEEPSEEASLLVCVVLSVAVEAPQPKRLKLIVTVSNTVSSFADLPTARFHLFMIYLHMLQPVAAARGEFREGEFSDVITQEGCLTAFLGSKEIIIR